MSKKDSKKNEFELKSLISSTDKKLPTEIKDFYKPLDDEKLEKISEEIYDILIEEKTPNFGLIVIRSMEIVEEIKKISGKDKCKVATRCIIKYIENNDNISEDMKIDYIISIPGLIESVIQLTKGEPLNRNTKDIDMIEISYITKRATEKIIEFIKYKKYDKKNVLKNIFLIATHVMYVVGTYPSLSGSEKKQIVINVISDIVHKYTENNEKISQHFIDMTLQSLPSIIDTLVDVSNHKFNINNVRTILSFIKSCCNCTN
tara:strand:+ start:297 stop:1076 length:780 start_codon:yes stop_codon:yes gene_type:complete